MTVNELRKKLAEVADLFGDQEMIYRHVRNEYPGYLPCVDVEIEPATLREPPRLVITDR